MFQDASIGETKVTYVIKRVAVLNSTVVSWHMLRATSLFQALNRLEGYIMHILSEHNKMDIWKTRICHFFVFIIISNPEKITPYILGNCFYELGKVCGNILCRSRY